MDFVVLSSSGGTTFRAVLDRIADGSLTVRCAGLVTDRLDRGCVEKARKAGLPVRAVERKEGETREEYDQRLDRAIFDLFSKCRPPQNDQPCHPEVRAAASHEGRYGAMVRGSALSLAPHHDTFVACIGWMWLLSPWFVQKWRNRIINVHPSLLPLHPGCHPHEEVLAAREKESGMTIHWVDEGTDTGPIIVQKKCSVFPDDTVKTLKARVQELEKEWYPKVLQRLQEESLSSPDEAVYGSTMSAPTYKTTCIRNLSIASDVHAFALQKPPGFSFQPGQFVLFQVPLAENSHDVQPRAYSIASAPEEPDLLFVLKIREGGRASRWCTDILKEGTAVTMQGPFGALLLDHATAKDYLFLCTSTGIAPFRSMILSALAAGDTRRMDLLFGAWNEEGLFWTDDFSRLTAKHPSFRYHIVLDSPSPTWNGHRGHVQDIAPRIVEDCGQRSIYICGNPVMVAAAKQCCLAQWGAPKDDVHVEGYI